MPRGLENLFAGLVGGIGQTTLDLQKEKRQREDQQQSQQLGLFTHLLTVPDLKPEVRQELFKQALDVASGGNKKLSEKVHSMLGHLIGGSQEGGGGQEGQQMASKGEQPQQTESATPSAVNPMGVGGGAQGSSTQQQQPSPSSKFEQPSSRSIFQSPEEITSQDATHAGAVAKATAQGTTSVTEPIEQARVQAAHEQEMKDEVAKGFELKGYNKNQDGTVTPVYINKINQQTKFGAPIPAFTSPEAMQQQEMLSNKVNADQKVNEDMMLHRDGIDPARATIAQRQKAAQKYAGLQVDAQTADTASKSANALESILRAKYLQAGGKDGAMTDAQLQIDYDRQWKEYDSRASKIQDSINEVDTNRTAAVNAFGQAQNVRAALEQAGVKPGDVDQAMGQQGITWAAYNKLMTDGNTYIGAMQQAADAAKQRFGDNVQSGLGGDNKKWPFLKSLQPEFVYHPPVGRKSLPDMPTKGGKGNSASNTEIDVPPSVLKLLYPNQ